MARCSLAGSCMLRQHGQVWVVVLHSDALLASVCALQGQMYNETLCT